MITIWDKIFLYFVCLNLLIFSNCTKLFFGTKNYQTDEFYSLRFLFKSQLSEINVNSNSFSDSTSPIPGNGGLIEVSKLGYSSVTINWTAASDDTSKLEKLQYSVYYSLEDNINSVNDLEKNAVILASKIENTTSLSISNLLKLNTYYFNILVNDEKGNSAIYLAKKIITPDDEIKLFVGGTSTGDFTDNGQTTARKGIDKLCTDKFDSSYINKYSCNVIKGFVSIDSNDEIRDMPNNYSIPKDLKIVGINSLTLNKIIFANNWSNLLDASNQNLYDTPFNIFGNSLDYYWTGSYGDGSVKSDSNCSNFSTATFGISGYDGDASKKDKRWIEDGGFQCDGSRYFLCVCY